MDVIEFGVWGVGLRIHEIGIYLSPFDVDLEPHIHQDNETLKVDVPKPEST